MVLQLEHLTAFEFVLSDCYVLQIVSRFEMPRKVRYNFLNKAKEHKKSPLPRFRQSDVFGKYNKQDRKTSSHTACPAATDIQRYIASEHGDSTTLFSSTQTALCLQAHRERPSWKAFVISP